MNFKYYVELTGLGSAAPIMAPPMVNNSVGATASDEVKRTNLQPQVDAKELLTTDDENDSILAIDSGIEHMDTKIPQNDENGTKVNRFRQLWDKFKTEWDSIKQPSNAPEPESGGLGQNTGNEKYTQMMQQFPNMVPVTHTPQGSNAFGSG